MGDIPPLTRFSERIRWLIQRNTRFGGTGVVLRQEVEEIGANLGMSEVGSCEGFSPSKAICGMCTPAA